MIDINLSVNIGDQSWTIITVKPMKDCYGYCDLNRKLIVIDENLSEEQFLIILCHEVCHAVFPKIKEKDIKLIGEELGRVLTKLGYKRNV